MAKTHCTIVLVQQTTEDMAHMLTYDK